MPTAAPAFGTRLMALRKALKVSREELARRLACAPSTVYRWEHDRTTPPPGTLGRIAAALGIQPEALR